MKNGKYVFLFFDLDSKSPIFVEDMKSHFFKYLFSITFAAYFLFAGTGFNVIRYCCAGCESEGIQNIVLESINSSSHEDCCAEVAALAESSDQDCGSNIDFAIDDPARLASGCHLFRISNETPIFENDIHTYTDFGKLILHFAIPACVVGFELQPHVTLTFSNSPPDFNIPSSGRDILTQKSVLII